MPIVFDQLIYDRVSLIKGIPESESVNIKLISIKMCRFLQIWKKTKHNLLLRVNYKFIIKNAFFVMSFDHIFIELLPFLCHMYAYMHTVRVLYRFVHCNTFYVCMTVWKTHWKDLCHMLYISLFTLLLKWNCFDSKLANLYVVFCPYVHLNFALHHREWLRLNNNK